MRRAALGRRAEIVAQTRAEAEAQVAEAITRLDAEAAEARRKLEADAQALGAAAAEQILGRAGAITRPRIHGLHGSIRFMTRHRLVLAALLVAVAGHCCVAGAAHAHAEHAPAAQAAQHARRPGRERSMRRHAAERGRRRSARSRLDADDLRRRRTSCILDRRPRRTSCARRSTAYLDGRIGKVREDLVTAAQTRETAVRQLAEIDAKLAALPARARGAEDSAAPRISSPSARASSRRRRPSASAARAHAARDRHAAARREARAARARRQPRGQRRRRAHQRDRSRPTIRRAWSIATRRSSSRSAGRGAPVTAGAAASRYARALFDVVAEGRRAIVEKVQAELQEFADALRRTRRWRRCSATRRSRSRRRRRWPGRWSSAPAQVTPPLAKLIVVLAEKDRLTLLPGIARAYRERRDGSPEDRPRRSDHRRRRSPPDKLRALEQGLRQATGRKVVARGARRPVDHRRRRHAPRQHGLRRQRHDAVAEDETVVDRAGQ